MRCKCCDEDNAEFILDDWYCSECSALIYEIIQEYEWYEEDEPLPLKDEPNKVSSSSR